MAKIKKIIKNVKAIISIDEKYNLSLVSASTSFYILVALFSLLSLAIQFYNTLFAGTNNFLVNSINDIINPYYHEYIEQILPVISLNSFSPILFISLFWSSSRLINGYNRVADIIYVEVKKRNGFLIRVSSFFMFLMIFCVLLFEIATALFATAWIAKFVSNVILFRIVQFIIELLVIFLIILILNMYAPPVPMTFKKTYFGSFVSTTLLYLSSVVIIIILKLYQRFNPNYGIISIISMLFIWIFTINYIIIIGFFLNYLINKIRISKDNKNGE